MTIEYKNSLVPRLLYVSFIIAFDYSKLHEENVKFKAILSENSYLKRFQDKIATKLYGKSFQKRILVTTVPKKTFSLVLSYTGTQPLRNCLKISYHLET